MAAHRFRVRRNTAKGPEVIGFADSFKKAHAMAAQQMRKTGSVQRIERRPPLGIGWETALELVPHTTTDLEAALARGRMPKVQDATGRKGQMLSFNRITRQARVAWLDPGAPDRGESVPIDQLSLRS